MALPMKNAMKVMKSSAMKAKTSMKAKAMKVMKKKAVSKIAMGKRAKSVVFRGSKEKTSGGLAKSQLMKNKRGKVVSKKMHAKGKTIQKFVQRWLDSVMTARKELGIKGFCAVGGKSAQGKALYAKAKVSQSRLPAEFNLLSQFEKHMQELQRARITAGWTYKPVAILHPHILKWEWMHPLYTNKGLPLRCEGLFEKKNPVGLVGYVQPLVQDTVTQVACFAVAASVRGGPGPTRSYPEGVTCLSAAHLGFILASTKLDSSKFGLRRFGFTMNGALAVLHRCLQLPDGSLHRSVWEKIHALRKALRWELEANWAQWEGAKVLYDSPVFTLAWDLHQATLKNHGLDLKQQAKFEEEQDCAVERLKSNMTVDLLAVPARPEAFLPVAEWQELAR
ncbi:unnamed protein product, partial [Symbiodinium sp. KB8]